MSFLPYGRRSSSGWFGAYGMSIAAHGGFALALVALRGLTWEPPAPPPPELNFTVTLERLDADTLAGIVLREGEAGAEGEDVEAELPDKPAEAEEDPYAEDDYAVLAPEPEEAEEEDDPAEGEEDPAEDLPLEEVEELTPEVPEPVTPEPTELATVEADALTPDPIAPEPVAAQPTLAPVAVPVTPDSPDLNPIMPETVAVAPVGVTPVGVSPTASAPVAVTPVASGIDSVAPVAGSDGPEVVTALARPVGTAPAQARPPAPPPSPPSAQDLAIGELIKRIRAQEADPCLTALPRRDGEDGVGLAMVAARDGAMEVFARDLLTPEDDIRQTRTLVDPRQCPVLAYLRTNRDYPATRMGLRVDTPEVPSGGRLTGVLRGVAGRHVTLLLIDDNGVVQDLQRFLAFSGNLVRFDVPVTRAGPTRDTSQILLALATRGAPSEVRARDGQLAQDVFAGLSGELADSALIATATFDVR